jgi:hypothetical protein
MYQMTDAEKTSNEQLGKRMKLYKTSGLEKASYDFNHSAFAVNRVVEKGCEIEVILAILNESIEKMNKVTKLVIDIYEQNQRGEL